MSSQEKSTGIDDFSASERTRSLCISQMKKLYIDLEKFMINYENIEAVSSCYEKLCKLFKQFEEAHTKCLIICTKSEVLSDLKSNYDSCNKNFAEFRERYLQWKTEMKSPDVEDEGSVISGVSVNTSVSSQVKLNDAKVKRLIEENRLKRLKEKLDMERAQKELQIKQQLFEQECMVEEAVIEETVWKQCAGEDIQETVTTRNEPYEDIESSLCQTKSDADQNSRHSDKNSLVGENFPAKELDLREDLVSCYKDSVSYIPISPVRDDLEVPLEELYVQPQLTVNTTHIFGQRGTTDSIENVNSYKEIFFGKQNRPYKKIYISANAGMGKTSFARKVTLTWCEALEPGKNSNGFFDREDLETVKHFDIIFYLELPHTKKCDIADMISDFIERHLSKNYQYTKAFVEHVLHTKKRLVILDSLDQWTHPESCSNQGVPHNRHRNVTVMTTTRPWKMSEMRLSTKQIDRHLELLDLTRRTTQDIEANAIRLLKKHNDSKYVGKDVDEFDDVIDKAELKDIQRKPYILLQLVCIWADRRPIGRSKFEAYCNIISLNIERRIHQRPRETRATRATFDYIVPKYMQNNPFLAENICIFLKVGELGLVALCEELTTPAYIVDKKLALKYITSGELNFFTETGLLSLTKDTSIISERREIVTFQHKAIEEFFVAFFMASVWKSRAKQRIILLKCRSLPDLFMTSFNNVMNLVKDINNDTYKDMYKRITDKESAVASDDIRLYGSRLTRISEEESVQIVEDCVDEKQCFAEGSFGKLFKSDGLKNRCGITVAVKKIQDERQLDDIPNTVKKEMNVSKVLYPFLLPLIAVIREVDEGRNTFYLISPFCEQGDLYNVLHTNKTHLDHVQRIRIVLQIGLGIQHLHTYVEGVKDVIIHKDICSDNIILDGRKNARLIDFGLARDKNDDTNTISKRIHYTHPDVGNGRKATEFWDYFSFGVVIRELLTGLPPEGKKETNLFLKKMNLKDVLDNLDQLLTNHSCLLSMA